MHAPTLYALAFLILHVMNGFGSERDELSNATVGLFRGLFDKTDTVECNISGQTNSIALRVSSQSGSWYASLRFFSDVNAANEKYTELFYGPNAPSIKGNFAEKLVIWERSVAGKNNIKGGSMLFQCGTIVVSMGGTDINIALGKAKLLSELLKENANASILKENLSKESSIMSKLQLQTKELPSIEDLESAIKKLKEDKFTEDPDELKCLQLIKRCGPNATIAVPLLITRLNTKNSSLIRFAAIEALEAIGDKSCIPALVKIFDEPVTGNINDRGESESIVRRQFVLAFEKIGDSSVMPLLRKLAASKNEYSIVREYANSASLVLEGRKNK